MKICLEVVSLYLSFNVVCGNVDWGVYVGCDGGGVLFGY